MILFFMLFFMITAKATEETKYIDLLPEKEKEIFLERIARRILEEVESKPVNKKSLEIPKEELDVHAEFVKKILKEEEANLRKLNSNDKDLSVKPLDVNRKDIDLTVRSRTRRNKDENADANSDLGNNGVHSDVETQIIKEPGSKSNEKDIQIKSFISNGNGTKVEPEANNNDVKTISTDNVSTETERPITENQDNVEEIKNSTFNFNDAEESKISTNLTDKTSSLIDLDTNSTSKVKENEFSQSNISQKINDENKEENKTNEGDNISTEKHANKTEITKEQVKEALRGENRTFLDIPVQILRDDATIKNIEETSSTTDIVSTTEEVTFTTTQKQEVTVETTTVKSELETKDNIKRDVDAVTEKNETHKEINDSGNTNLNDHDKFKINTTSTNNTNNNLYIDLETKSKASIDVESKTIPVKPLNNEHNLEETAQIISTDTENTGVISEVNSEPVTEDKTVKREAVESQIVRDDDSVEPKIYHIKPIHQRDTKDMEQEFEVTTQQIEVLTPLIPLISKYNTKNKVNHIKKVDSNIIQVLRDVINRNKVKANGRFGGIESTSKVKEHKVYEIPKEKTLVIDDFTNKEQPYYYPIYNYAPSNAYYNAHNNFGPNQNDLGVQKLKNQDHRISNFQTDYFFDDDNNRKFRLTDPDSSDKHYLKLPVVVKYPINFIADYEEPIVSRTRSKSNEKDKKEDKNLKSSLREIRMMMYANKHFGYVPDHKPYISMEVGGSNCSENTTEKSHLRAKFEAILEKEKKKKQKKPDQSNIAVDYFFSRINDDLKTKKIKQRNVRPIKKDINKPLDKIDYKIFVIDPANLNKYSFKENIAREDEKKPDYDKIMKILNIGNVIDAIPTMNKLLKMNITRSSVKEKDVNLYVDVLTDMIQTENEALEQYDWLGTTVNIQGATLKILELTQLVLRGKYINPSDLELLKYIIYLFKESSNIINQFNEGLRINLPRGKNMKRKIIKTKGLIDRVWLYRQSIIIENDLYKLTKKDMESFGEFLNILLNSLYELHTAIKEIAGITKYNHQHWFKNLKELYLNRTRNRTLEVLLHFTANRLLDLVETSAKNGLEKDYLKYMKKNYKEVGRTVNEFVFLMKLLNEIENYE